jgi:hypothetical protein
LARWLQFHCNTVRLRILVRCLMAAIVNTEEFCYCGH